MGVTQEQTRLIRVALERYLSEADPRAASYREQAGRYSLLPIFPDWSGFIGLRQDGQWFVVLEDGSISHDINEHLLHLARLRGSELFPELAFLAPTVAADWIVCWSCGGSGQVTFEGQPLDNVRCQCGGLGRLPPDVAALLRAKHG
jgi:hypothetical protein